MLVFWGSFAYDMYADRFLICGGGKEEPVLKKLSVCVLFGGVAVSRIRAEPPEQR